MKSIVPLPFSSKTLKTNSAKVEGSPNAKKDLIAQGGKVRQSECCQSKGAHALRLKQHMARISSE